LNGEPAMSLAQALWQANQDIAARILAHGFVRGLGTGALPLDHFKSYVAQDAYFLEAFARAYGYCLGGSQAREDIESFADLIAGVREELGLHKSYAARWGARLDGVTPGKATAAYVDFLLATARLGALGDTIAAMTPCMRLYAFLGQSLALHSYGERYAEWIKTYADPAFEALAARLEGLLDRHAEDTETTRANYRRAMQLEYDFFDANF
jgi:thiaminase/transcriptional activator TenA